MNVDSRRQMAARRGFSALHESLHKALTSTSGSRTQPWIGRSTKPGIWILYGQPAPVSCAPAKISQTSPFELVEYARTKLHGLRALPEGWNGPGSIATTTNAIIAMDSLLQKVIDRRTVFPFLAPDGQGGVLAEWHAKEQKVEIEVDPYGNAYVYATDRAGNQVLDGTVTPRLEQKLRRVLLDLSARVAEENPTWRSLFTR